MISFIKSIILKKSARVQELTKKVDAIQGAFAVIEFTQDGIITQANTLFCETMGYASDEIIGRHHKIFAEHSWGNSAEYKNFWRRLSSGECHTGEIKRVKKDGQSVWLSATYWPIINDEGSVYKIVKIASDITRTKNTAQLASALTTCQSSVVLVNKTGKVSFINQKMKSLIESCQDAFDGALLTGEESCDTSIPIDELIKDKSVLGKIVAVGDEPLTIEYEISNHVFEISASQWLSHNEVIGLNIEFRDLTQEREDQQQSMHVASQNARVKSALDRVATNVLITDKDGLIIYVNRSMEAMLSSMANHPQISSLKTLIGSDVAGVFSPATGIKQHLNTLGDTHTLVEQMGGKHFEVTLTPVTHNGARVGVAFEWQDKTDEIVMEKEVGVLVEAANRGDFTIQIPVADKTGYVHALAQGLNNLSGTVEVALNDISRVLGALSRGVLTERITRDYEGAFGELKESANQSIEKVNDIINKISDASNTISASANEISQGNADLSTRTEQQASSLEQTAASMEEMTSTVRQSTDNAYKANELSSHAQLKASEGGKVVAEAVSAMQDINESSKKINDIISVIDEIAFQTNLLALNAAVEAARAGEQGRGFAVVAGEVRNLAQRSAGAAKEIKELIRDSVKKIEGGTELVNRSGDTLSQLVGAVETVSSVMNEISSASKEQATGIEQVNTAVSHMDEMTQQNAALVEEASAASEAMAEQAARLIEEVSFFEVANKRAANSSLAAVKPSEASHVEPAAQGTASRLDIPSSSTVKQVKKPAEPEIAVTKDVVSSVDDDDEWEDF